MKSATLFLFAFALFLLVGRNTNAQEAVINQASTSPIIPKITYELPYPGMLPDSPFYKIKVFRDKLITFLISDPEKKIDFYLLQADKGIRAASMLVDKKNTSLAKEVALKAEHNMTLIPDQLARTQTKPTSELFGKLETASKKHAEVLEYIIQNTTGEDRKVFMQILDFSKRNLVTIKMYEKRPANKWHAM